MKSDVYGRQILEEMDLVHLFYSNPEASVKNVLVEKQLLSDSILELDNFPQITVYEPADIAVSEFDEICQSVWFLPEEYKNLDIAKFVLDQCKTDEELQRAGHELLLFQERDMFMLLKYLKYLVDTMRSNNIVWGVGRGSSVSSYVLFLIGVHRINSLHYDLSIDEFLK